MSFDWSSVGLALIFAGFITILLAVILGFSGGRVKGGGLVLLWPFPIVFGSDAKMVRFLAYLALAFIGFFLLSMVLLAAGGLKP